MTDKAYDKLSILDKKEYQKRKFTKYIDNLKNEIDRLERLKKDAEAKGFSSIFKNFDKEDIYTSQYVNDDIILQCKSCSNCQCSSCVKQCNFSSCEGCRRGSSVVYCNREDQCLIKYDDYKFEIYDNNRGQNITAKGICSVELGSFENKFLHFQNGDDKIIVGWEPGIRDDKYIEITDEAIFDKVVSIIEENLE